MKRKCLPSLLALSLFIFCSSVATAGTIDWQPSWDTALMKSKSSGKLIMLDIYVDWCGWCKKLDSDVYPNPGVVNALGQFVPVRLSGEGDGRDIAVQYKVHGYPTIIFFDNYGKEVHRIVGYEDAVAFTRTLNEVAQAYGPKDALNKADPTQPNQSVADAAGRERELNASDLARMITKTAGQGRFDEAEMLVETVERKNAYDQLGRIYNTMGDSLMNRHSSIAATQWYEKTVSHSWNMGAVVHAHMQLAKCYGAHNQMAEAENELQTIINHPKAPNNAKNDAYTLLKRLRAHHG